MLLDYNVESNDIEKIVTLISSRSLLYKRKLYNEEIRNIIQEVSGINLPTSLIYQYTGPEKAFFLLKVRPHLTSRITEKIESLEGVERVLETFGIYDIIVETYTYKHMQKAIESVLQKDLIEIFPLIVG
jgi:hypothetical protein